MLVGAEVKIGSAEVDPPGSVMYETETPGTDTPTVPETVIPGPVAEDGAEEPTGVGAPEGPDVPEIEPPGAVVLAIPDASELPVGEDVVVAAGVEPPEGTDSLTLEDPPTTATLLDVGEPEGEEPADVDPPFGTDAPPLGVALVPGAPEGEEAIEVTGIDTVTGTDSLALPDALTPGTLTEIDALDPVGTDDWPGILKEYEGPPPADSVGPSPVTDVPVLADFEYDKLQLTEALEAPLERLTGVEVETDS